jgi:adenylate cyclase
MTSDDEPTERLAAILAADAAGYSRLMRIDERRTVATLDEYRGVFRDAITQHGGRVVDMAGDSILAVFASVGGAVASAIEIQASLAQRNATREPDHAMEFRIGINLGDILEKSDGSIYGDGVNVAARLESLAVPGGINVSGSVYDSVRSKISAAFEFIGEQALKNITNPVSVYRLLPAAAEPGVATPRLTQPGPAATATVPKVAVTPFTVISGDAGIESLAAGLYQDIVRGLTRQSAIAVQGRDSTANADFRLEGNIRAAGDRLRLSFALIDTAADRQLWSERYDRRLDDIFDLEDEISFTVASTVRLQIKARTFEKLRDADNANLSNAELLSKAAGYFITSYRHNDEAATALNAVLAREPDNAMANAMMVFCRYRIFEFSPLAPTASERSELLAQIGVSLAADRRSYFAHLIAAIVHQDLLGDFAAARVHVETSLEINPGFAPASGTLGAISIHTGDRERGFVLLRNALAAAPEDPHHNRLYRELALAHFLSDDLEESVNVIERLLRRAPELARNRLVAAALFALGGRDDAAMALIAKLRQAFPALRAANARATRFHDPDVATRFAGALRAAGLPQ